MKKILFLSLILIVGLAMSGSIWAQIFPQRGNICSGISQCREIQILMNAAKKPGPAGPKGDPGAIGAVGPAGAQGVAGPIGPVGPADNIYFVTGNFRGSCRRTYPENPSRPWYCYIGNIPTGQLPRCQQGDLPVFGDYYQGPLQLGWIRDASGIKTVVFIDTYPYPSGSPPPEIPDTAVQLHTACIRYP